MEALPTTGEQQALAQQVGRLLARLAAEMMQYSATDMLRLLQREDMSLPRMVTLTFLRRRGSASVSDVAEHLNLSLGATSHLVDKLVDGGFVTRTEDPTDRRQRHLALTDAGLAFTDEVRRVRVDELARRLEQLPAPLLATTSDVLGDVLAELGVAEPC